MCHGVSECEQNAGAESGINEAAEFYLPSRGCAAHARGECRYGTRFIARLWSRVISTPTRLPWHLFASALMQQQQQRRREDTRSVGSAGGWVDGPATRPHALARIAKYTRAYPALHARTVWNGWTFCVNILMNLHWVLCCSVELLLMCRKCERRASARARPRLVSADKGKLSILQFLFPLSAMKVGWLYLFCALNAFSSSCVHPGAAFCLEWSIF